MSSLLVFTLFGLVSGALTALVAVSVVLTYRTTKVVDFSISAMGSISAYCCYTLISHGLPTWAALLAGVLTGMGLGMVTFLALTVLRKSSVLVQFMATLGLFMAAQSFTLLVWGPVVTTPNSLLPTAGIQLAGGLQIGVDRLILLGAALLVCGVAAVVYHRTLFGLATSAVAESPLFIASSGWSTARIQLINFLVSGALTAAAIIFLAPIVGLSGPTLAVLILPALAAALAGRFSSFGWTVVAALAMGVAQSLLSLFGPDLAQLMGVSALSISALPNAVPLVVIILLTVVRGRARLQRGDHQPWLPRPGDGRIPLLPLFFGVLAVGVLLSLDISPGWAQALIATFAGAIILLSVIVVTGIGGQFSLCQYALTGFAGWVAARVAAATGISFVPALLCGTLAAMLLGALIGQAARRARGMVLAVATLGFALLLNVLIFNNSSLTGGFTGINVATPTIFGYSLDPIGNPRRYAWFGLGLFLLCAWLVSNVRRGRVGLRMLAVRSDEQAAAALGIGVAAVKTYAFVVGAGLAGLAGGYLTFQFPHTEFTHYDTVSSIAFVQLAVLGGLGWVGGAVAGSVGTAGALLPYAVNAALGSVRAINTWFAVVSGVLLVLALRASPDGIVSVWAGGFNRPHAEQERVRLGIPAKLFRLLGGLEITAAACLMIGIVVPSSAWAGLVAGLLLTGLLLSVHYARGTLTRGVLAAAAWPVGACVGTALGLLFQQPLAVFILGQVSAVTLFMRGSARLNRRWMDRLRLPRPPRRVQTLPARERTPLMLEVDDVTVRFGGVVAVDKLNFTVRPGEIVGLIGPNGAGKTTALDAITGFAPIASGQVRIGGQTATRWSPERVARAGMIRSWQSVGLFSAMSVRENLLIAADPHRAHCYFADPFHPGTLQSSAVVEEVVRELHLEPWLDSPREVLPQGIGRLVGIARALCAEPSFLLLDEPTAGLEGEEAAEIFGQVRRYAKRTGIGVLLVEHDVPLVTTLCDRLIVLNFGRKIADGPPQSVIAHPEVAVAYFGSTTGTSSSRAQQERAV